MGTIAAPLLGGFSIAMIGVVAQASDRFRWPGISLTLLAAWYEYQDEPTDDVLKRLAEDQLKLVELNFGWVDRAREERIRIRR